MGRLQWRHSRGREKAQDTAVQAGGDWDVNCNHVMEMKGKGHIPKDRMRDHGPWLMRKLREREESKKCHFGEQ